MIISMKIILTAALLMLCIDKTIAMPLTYVAKIPVPQTTSVIEVPISFDMLQRAKPNLAEEDIKHLLNWVMQDALSSTNPFLHHELSEHIAMIKNSLKGHAAVFDAELLTEGKNLSAKLRMDYFQIAALYTDIARSLQRDEQFRQAFALAEEDLVREEATVMMSNYDLALYTVPTISSTELAARLMEARLNAVVNYDHETVRKQLSQKFALLDIAQQNAELGTYLALRYAILHHLYQQQIALRLTADIANHERNALEREQRFHQAREEFSRTLYLLLQQDKS